MLGAGDAPVAEAIRHEIPVDARRIVSDRGKNAIVLLRELAVGRARPTRPLAEVSTLAGHDRHADEILWAAHAYLVAALRAGTDTALRGEIGGREIEIASAVLPPRPTRRTGDYFTKAENAILARGGERNTPELVVAQTRAPSFASRRPLLAVALSALALVVAAAVIIIGGPSGRTDPASAGVVRVALRFNGAAVRLRTDGKDGSPTWVDGPRPCQQGFARAPCAPGRPELRVQLEPMDGVDGRYPEFAEALRADRDRRFHLDLSAWLPEDHAPPKGIVLIPDRPGKTVELVAIIRSGKTTMVTTRTVASSRLIGIRIPYGVGMESSRREATRRVHAGETIDLAAVPLVPLRSSSDDPAHPSDSQQQGKREWMLTTWTLAAVPAYDDETAPIPRYVTRSSLKNVAPEERRTRLNHYASANWGDYRDVLSFIGRPDSRASAVTSTLSRRQPVRPGETIDAVLPVRCARPARGTTRVGVDLEQEAARPRPWVRVTAHLADTACRGEVLTTDGVLYSSVAGNIRAEVLRDRATVTFAHDRPAIPQSFSLDPDAVRTLPLGRWTPRSVTDLPALPIGRNEEAPVELLVTIPIRIVAAPER